MSTNYFIMRTLQGFRCAPVATMEGSCSGLVTGSATVRMPGVDGLCSGCERVHAKFSRSAGVARPGKLGSRAFRASESCSRFTSISVAASSVRPSSSSSLLCTKRIPHHHGLIIPAINATYCSFLVEDTSYCSTFSCSCREGIVEISTCHHRLIEHAEHAALRARLVVV
jgi:hypothetical protein